MATRTERDNVMNDGEEVTFDVDTGVPEAPGRTYSTMLTADGDLQFDTCPIAHIRPSELAEISEAADSGPSGDEEQPSVIPKRRTSVFEEPVQQPDHLQLRKHKKHIFILSEAGKPIYTRHGREEDFSTIMGVIQALVSFTQADNDLLQNITTYSQNSKVVCRLCFLCRPPLIMAAISTREHDTIEHMNLELQYLYGEIVCVLTAKQLTRIFETRKNYDLRRLLTGTERALRNLQRINDKDPAVMLNAVRCLPLPAAVRDAAGQAISQVVAKVKNLVFVILLAGSQLVTMARLKKYTLHPADLHLIINLVNSNPSFRLAESWSPICLPKFDNSGYLHAHISYLSEHSPACLLLLTVDRNAFFELSEIRTKILERLTKQKVPQAIADAMQKSGIQMADVGLNGLWHFLYKNRTSAQYIYPQWGVPYLSTADQRHLLQKYKIVHQRMHQSEFPMRLFYSAVSREVIMGWITPGFELYATFSPFMTKSFSVTIVDKLIKWMKKEEDRLFILSPPVF